MIIDWPDGSGDQITISPANGSGNAIMEMTSPANMTGVRRSVTVRLDGTYDNVRAEFVVYQEPTQQALVTEVYLEKYPDWLTNSEIDYQLEHVETFSAHNHWVYVDDIVVDGDTYYLFEGITYQSGQSTLHVIPYYMVLPSRDPSYYSGKTMLDLGHDGRNTAIRPVVAPLNQDMTEYENNGVDWRDVALVKYIAE